MRRSLSAALALGLLLSGGVVVAAMAHEGSGEETIEVEPPTVTAGDSVVLAGSGLEPNDERVIVLVGEHDTIHLTEVETDAEGMFSTELTIPGHLPSGAYELRAIGDETVTTTLAVTAAAGGAQASPADASDEAVIARERTPVELGAILVLVVLAAAVGVFLVLRAERFQGHASA